MEDEGQDAFADVKWEDVCTSEGNLIVKGFKGSGLKSKDLRKICSRLKIEDVKNATKETMVGRIINMHGNQEKYECLRKEVKGEATKPRKEAQCSYRLLNIMFSNEFAGKVAVLGDVATRNLLDTGKAGKDEHCWEEVHEAFIRPNEAYGKL
mmetsp:Transcript_32321/g.49417  ORF Transcript_32321/g.49417 Transcript_32321/m.49417 type:complete len:152 (+) Transcript_32321:171-626(+)